jgi:Spy/CpxP family protein refolding chaperone
MKRYQKALLAAGVALLLGATVVTAAQAQNLRRLQQNRQAISARNMFRPGVLLAGLKLTDQQKEQAKTILAGHKEDIQAQFKAVQEARRAFREAVVAGSDLTALKPLYDDVSNAEWNGLVLQNQIVSEIKAILTPEQQEQLQNRLQRIRRAGILLQNRRFRKI